MLIEKHPVGKAYNTLHAEDPALSSSSLQF